MRKYGNKKLGIAGFTKYDLYVIRKRANPGLMSRLERLAKQTSPPPTGYFLRTPNKD